MLMIQQMMVFIYEVFTIFMVFLGVVFVTLVERKILGLIHFRKGPNKVFLKGGIQSLGDALKLVSKSVLMFFFFSWVEYNLLPLGMLLVMMMVWGIVPNGLYDFSNNILMLLCIFSVGVYPIMFGSWFSGSLYSMLGSIRSIAQMVSYEVSMIMIIISLVIFSKSFNLHMLNDLYIMGVLGFFVIVVLMLLTSFLVELGRTPVDLLEGESELVSGFNTEYFGLKFAFVFLSEYGMIMFMAGFLSALMGLAFFSTMWGFITIIIILLILWIRGALPRIRYDKLMFLCWVSMLNLSLGILTINGGVMLMC